MSVHVYDHRDADAPVLTSDGPGALANLLRKCLVDGYGSGAEATAPAGWTMDWDTSTNARIALLPGPLEAQGCHYYVDDTGTVGAGGNRWARIWMAEDWQGWDTNGDPTGTLIPNDVPWGRTLVKNSTDLDATAVSWMVIATDSYAYMLVDHLYQDPNFSGVRWPVLAFFGRPTAHSASDEWLDVIAATPRENYTSTLPGYMVSVGNPANYGVGDVTSGIVARRDYSGINTASMMGSRAGAAGAFDTDQSTGYSPAIPYPDPVTGGLLTGRCLIMQGDPGAQDSVIRGHFPGFRWPLHRLAHGQGDTVLIDGRRHISINTASGANNNGNSLIDIDGPWE